MRGGVLMDQKRKLFNENYRNAFSMDPLQTLTRTHSNEMADPDEITAEDSAENMQDMSSDSGDPVCLEGVLFVRKGRSSGRSTFLWKRRFVSLDFSDGGSITVYRGIAAQHSQGDQKQIRSMIRKVYSTILRQSSWVDIYIPTDLPYVVRDVELDSAGFVVEIPSTEENVELLGGIFSVSEEGDDISSDGYGGESLDYGDSTDDDGDGMALSDSGESLLSVSRERSVDCLRDEILSARRKGRPLRIYFRCGKGSDEKALWLKAFSRLERFAMQAHVKNSFISALASTFRDTSLNKVRTRRDTQIAFARDARELDLGSTEFDIAEKSTIVDTLVTSKNYTKTADVRESRHNREYRVQPSYAYPYRWMTQAEMREEMLLASEHFHDLRVPGCKQKEIGSLRVEVLQCLGLPKLDRTSDTDAVVYLVCGSYAFSTDTIPNRSSPLWPRKSRRACDFPIFHGYARLYVGVFDNDKRRVKSDFAGRVVIDLAPLRPRSTYDVTLPLRLSSHVYSRRKRGAIRLRFTLQWHSEKEALLSYLPKQLKIPLPQNSKPNFDVAVNCADPKAFRNIAITVHGSHLPGRFTFHQMRAGVREMNFTRKYLFSAIRQEFREIRQWQNPAMSAFIFLAWMHCIYENAFALVPAYTVLLFVLYLMRNYAKYGMDTPFQRGFIPPSWEEMLFALIYGNKPGFQAIEPLELALRPVSRLSTMMDFVHKTHEPKGKRILKSLGFLTDQRAEESHFEFPFANGTEYPKFSVKECLRDRGHISGRHTFDTRSFDGSIISSDTLGERRRFDNLRFPIEVDIPDIMRKDESGTKDYDEEEKNFRARKAVVAAGKKAKNRLTGAATLAANELTDITRLNHVISPIKSSFDHSSAIVSNRVNDMILHPIQNHRGHLMKRTQSTEGSESHVESAPASRKNSEDLIVPLVELPMDPTQQQTTEPGVWPDQDIDIEGPNTGKKLTDDLAEIKDKMHELTWHLFDDHAYHIKSAKTAFFGQAKKPEKRRKNVSKHLDKLLQVGQYSHSNPFVARVGMYVEPIIGSSYSFLCLFRAGFNVLTWRDPMLTFWLSLLAGILSFILFIFPWRIFLFVLGFWLVGPQNWLIRELRRRGHLPPLDIRKNDVEEKIPNPDDDVENIPTSQPVFTSFVKVPGHNRETEPNIEPVEIQRVVVPYTPLMYQRFYDWPPEPQYAKVKRATEDRVRAATDYSSPDGEMKRKMGRLLGRQQLNRIRRRFVRKRSFDLSVASSHDTITGGIGGMNGGIGTTMNGEGRNFNSNRKGFLHRRAASTDWETLSKDP